MARHHLTHAEEVKGGHDSHEHSHAHHKKMAHHHHKEMKHHIDHLAKMASHAHKSHSKSHHGTEHHQHAHKTTAHDRAVDRRNLSKARHSR